jgi:acyl-CoA dehydrogenase
MLLDMRSTSEAMRALALVTAAQADLARAFPNTGEGAAAQARLDLLTPIVKGWCTETAVEVASLGIQVHGGMGYVEETGAARWWRDSRITPIYEGTTGIQAADLSGRKLRLDDGAAMFALLDEIGATAQALKGGAQAFAGVGAALADAVLHLRASTRLQLTRMRDGERDAALAVSVPFLLQAGWVASAWQMARALRKTAGGADPFSRAKHRSALHFLEQMLPRALALGARVRVPARSDPLPH